MTAGMNNSGIMRQRPPSPGAGWPRGDAELRVRESSRTGAAGGTGQERLLGAIVAMTDLITEESEAISSGGAKEVEKFFERKAQAFVDLDRRMRGSPGCLADVAVGRAIAALREVLAANSRKLKYHMVAVAEVAQLVIRAIESEQSDGTYDASRRAGGFGRTCGSD